VLLCNSFLTPKNLFSDMSLFKKIKQFKKYHADKKAFIAAGAQSN